MYVNTDHHPDTHISPTPTADRLSYGCRIRRCSSSSQLYSENFAAQPSMSRRSIPLMRLPLPAVFNGERSQGGSNRSRPNSPRPSVAIMKKLMPLKLSSVPSVGENQVKVHADRNWPLSTPQSTPAKDELDSDSTSLTTDRSSLSTAQSTDSFRDIPYCMKPGLPSPSRVYFTKEDGFFQDLPPGSPCRAPRVAADYQNLDAEDYFTDCAEEFGHECNDCDGCEGSRVTSFDSSRASGLSIQCLGQNLEAEEASWLGNSMFDKTRSESAVSCDEQSDGTSILSFDSGTSRWTPPPQHNEVFEHATALSPAKAHVIHVRKSSIPAYPPRQSSLLPKTPEFFATSFFYPFNHTTPPDSPDDAVTLTENEDYDSTPRASHLPATKPLPNLHLDLAFSSPPTSPARTVHLCPSLNSLRLTPCFSSSSSSTTSSASISSSPLTTTTRSILTAIVNAIDGFPSTMLLPSTPCITQLRTLQHRDTLTPSFSSTSLSSLDTFPPVKESRSRRKSKTTALFAPLRSASSSSASTSTSSTSAASSYTSANTSASPPLVPEPNLQPLTRIFPHTTPFMHGALYAHLLAYNFAVETQCTLDGSAARRMPSKAARVMGVEQSEEDMTAVVDGVRDVVMRLVQGMGGECTGGLVVALGEVVRLCEV